MEVDKESVGNGILHTKWDQARSLPVVPTYILYIRTYLEDLKTGHTYSVVCIAIF